MKAGVSTACLFPKSMEQALHLLGRQGIRLCECFFNTPRELKPEAVTRLKAAAGSYGMEIGSVHGFHSEMETFFFFTDYPGRLEDGLEQYRRYYEAAARLGAKYLIFHGDFAMNRSFSEEKAFDNIRCLWEEGRRFGVELLHENVARCKGGRPDYLARLHRAFPELGFVLDCKQALRAGYTASDFVDALGSSIRHIHLSDSSAARQQDCLPPGKGDWDMEGFFRRLLAAGADCSVVVELYSNSFEQVEELTQACEFTQRMLERVKNYYGNSPKISHKP